MTALFGLPTLLSGQNFIQNAQATLLSAAEGALFDLISASPTWGVFTPGSTAQAVEVDSVVGSDITRDNPVSDYRIESGSFTTYNKVQRPGVARLTLSKGGTIDERNSFLGWLEGAVNSTSTYDIYWPEGAYQNYTLSAYRVSRAAHHGVTVIYAECVFIKVREISALYYNSSQPSTDTSNAASPDDLPVLGTQRVQGILASATQGVSSTINAAGSALSGVQSSITGTINQVAGAIRWN